MVSCRMSKEDLYVKCQNDILDSHFFVSLNQYFEEDLESGEFRFQYHRLNAKAVFTSDTKEENIDFKKNKINDLLKKISGETGIHIIEIYKKGNDYEFYGVENCSFSIVRTSDIKKYIDENYKGYIYFERYDENLLDKYPQCVFKLKGNYFLVINQLWPPS